jgi:hypothetical protein
MLTTGIEVRAFQQRLRDLGYIEGQNILIEYRYPEGKADRVPSLVAEVVQLKVDVLVVGSPGAVQEAKRATKTIPIDLVHLYRVRVRDQSENSQADRTDDTTECAGAGG